MRKGKQLFVV